MVIFSVQLMVIFNKNDITFLDQFLLMHWTLHSLYAQCHVLVNRNFD